MKLRVWANWSLRKLQSLWSYLKRDRAVIHVKSTESLHQTLLGKVYTLEVLVPVLVNNDWESIYVSNSMLDEVKFWLDELRVVHDASHLRFRVSEPFVTMGWDEATGMRGRVVGLELWGVRNSVTTLKQEISKASEELHDAIALYRKHLSAQPIVESGRQKMSDLLVEKSKQGDILNRWDLSAYTEFKHHD
jgi:hypothetical protein